MGFSDASLLTKVALGLAIASFLFHIIGFPTNSWLTFSTSVGTRHVGLFKVCVVDVCVDIDSSDSDWWTATKALEVLGFLVGLACLVLLVVFIFLKTDLSILHIVALVAAFVAGGFVLLGCIVFGAKRDDTDAFPAYSMGWSFVLTLIGSLLYLATGVILLVDKLKG
ncbi:uncharacterized protein [Haliotis cracherodii]|uniref:uncharacterized protein n=1 Tax=Haliotis cracherodii TaxID=6455 RepID=UPI0039E9B912